MELKESINVEAEGRVKQEGFDLDAEVVKQSGI
jgi:hypothetical protein